MFREYKPTGFDSWHKYYEAKEDAAKKKAELKGSILTVLYVLALGAFVFGMLWLGYFLDFVSQH